MQHPTTVDPHAHHKMMGHSMKTMDHQQHAAPGHGSHSMAGMVFHFGYQEEILFKQWTTDTVGSKTVRIAFIASWIAIFVLAILYEGLKTVRDRLAKREACRCRIDGVPNAASNRSEAYERANDMNLLPTVRTTSNQGKHSRLLSTSHVIQTVLHILQMGISYLLMLIAMTFNVYLFFAVILGAGLGHFLFGWCRVSVLDCNDHCH